MSRSSPYFSNNSFCGQGGKLRTQKWCCRIVFWNVMLCLVSSSQHFDNNDALILWITRSNENDYNNFSQTVWPFQQATPWSSDTSELLIWWHRFAFQKTSILTLTTAAASHMFWWMQNTLMSLGTLTAATACKFTTFHWTNKLNSRVCNLELNTPHKKWPNCPGKQ
jgi:hypothetical protein